MSAIKQPMVPAIQFPDSDGKPMAENTRQYEAIVTLKGNIEAVAPDTAFVAGDHLIYTDPLDPAVCQAPDVYVAFGRPRGHRGSYKVWEEGNVFPQVIFEVISPSNTVGEMQAKRAFYRQHGAEEYYEFEPVTGSWDGWVRNPTTGRWRAVEMDDHVSPRLGVRFEVRDGELVIFRPDGSRFLSFQELNDRAASAQRRAEMAEAEVARLRERLRAAGIDPAAGPAHGDDRSP